MMVELRLNHLAIAEANAVASPYYGFMEEMRQSAAQAEREYDEVWREAFEIAKKADRNKDGYGIMPQ